MLQLDYIELAEEKVARRLPFNRYTLARELKIPRQTMSRWRRDPNWTRRFAETVHRALDPEVELAHLANIKAAQGGNPLAYQMMLRSRGLWDSGVPPADVGDDGRAPGSNVNVGVTIVGLPLPPSKAERERMLPPPGSAMILRTDGTLEDASHKPAAGR